MNRRYLHSFVALSLMALSWLTASGSAQDSNSDELFRDPVRQFVPLVSYSLNAQPQVICVGDFNSDGKLDLAVVGDTSDGSLTVTIALGLGYGKFALQKDFAIPPGGYAPGGISAADLNHDGKLDLVVTGQGAGTVGTVNILLGNGDGTFSAGVTYNAGGAGSVVSDFNGDGIPDIASPQESNTGANILLGNGDGTFIAGTSLSFLYGVGGNPLVADLNHDGKLDLVFQLSYGGGFYVSLGNGDGTFRPAVFYRLPDSFSREVVADFNQDGIPDVGFAGQYDYCSPAHFWIVGVALGNGDGTFQAPSLQKFYNCGGSLPVAADFNGDGKMDLLEVSTTMLFLGKGTGVLDDGDVSGSLGAFTYGGVAADLNGDGAPDVVVLDYFYNKIDVSLNVSGDREILASSMDPSKVGQSVTFTAHVRATVNKEPVTGTVTFHDGKVTLSKVTLSGGIATFTTSSLAKGTHRVSAVYSGDHNYIPKTAKLVQTVGQ